MTIITLVGIDPGARNTGAVRINLNDTLLTHSHEAAALPGNDSEAVKNWVGNVLHTGVPYNEIHLFGELYRNRGTHTHQGISKLEGEIRSKVSGIQWIDNTGMKKVVTKELLELLNLWDFSTPSFHQDLRAAARIALYGALKDPRLNEVVYKIIDAILSRKVRTRPTAADYRAYYKAHPEELGEHNPML